jgi:hypothetical protein
MLNAALAVLLLVPFARQATTPEQVFEKRIAPIFKSPNPSSCVQCHLVGVDLKNYIRPSSKETFLSLRDQGLVDLDKPEKSRILALIDMGKAEKGAAAVHQKNRTAEIEAFTAWIKACCADKELRDTPKLKVEDLAKPPRPVEVIRHARKDQLLESFTNSDWAMRFRCMSCHIEGSAENKKLVAENGDRVSWFKAGGPEAMLKYLMESKLIDLVGVKRVGDKPFDGISMALRLLGKDDPAPDRVLFQHWAGKVSARDQRFRLDHTDQLFDMETDSDQKNVASDHLASERTRTRWNAT